MRKKVASRKTRADLGIGVVEVRLSIDLTWLDDVEGEADVVDDLKSRLDVLVVKLRRELDSVKSSIDFVVAEGSSIVAVPSDDLSESSNEDILGEGSISREDDDGSLDDDVEVHPLLLKLGRSLNRRRRNRLGSRVVHRTKSREEESEAVEVVDGLLHEVHPERSCSKEDRRVVAGEGRMVVRIEGLVAEVHDVVSLDREKLLEALILDHRLRVVRDREMSESSSDSKGRSSKEKGDLSCFHREGCEALRSVVEENYSRRV